MLDRTVQETLLLVLTVLHAIGLVAMFETLLMTMSMHFSSGATL